MKTTHWTHGHMHTRMARLQIPLTMEEGEKKLSKTNLSSGHWQVLNLIMSGLR
uniref:Uncharacterized protein n=1 Tax=Arion vulgaris TaxID=1028688 RepID=A0A0B7A9V6_9EUPU